MLETGRLIVADASPVTLPLAPVRALHVHDATEVGLCVGGNGLWFVEGNAYALSAGDAVIVPAGRAHYSRSLDADGCRCLFLYFDEETLLDGSGIAPRELLRDREADPPAVLRRRDHAEACELLTRMVEAVWKRPDEPRIAAHWYALFLLHLPDGSARPALTRSDVTPAMERILVDFTEDLTLADLAAACAISPGWLLKRFREEYGTTPLRYLHALRTDLAAQLLLGSDRSVTEIARLVGYATPSELYRHFSARFRVSPQQYRALRV